jgi:hypothetical protein
MSMVEAMAAIIYSGALERLPTSRSSSVKQELAGFRTYSNASITSGKISSKISN